ncbi:multidrug transporter AcrB [Desulfosarcina widdelii]|uniref:Multidrug transporter AcrB n=1 Tax=Desulfosarcina widdelii TaxID=947919 RepID=A0A5K7ZHU5_9BACT|nr:efflux RND transporter permease subunit [Desulfosarcina widdelii]BBO75647.1 multidrug transporter AcrB [Desulfosarcina widdelii]
MKKLAQWSVDNRVAVNLIMMFIIVAGLLTVVNMRREMFPQYALDMINVTVPYPGASPAEVEEGICIKIEEKIKGIENIKRTYSSSREGSGSVTVELDKDADVQKAMDDIKNEVDLIDTFPDEAEDPIITEIINRNPAITVAVYGDVPEKLLRRTADRIRDDLVDTGPISLATLVGVRDYEIAVEVSEENLRRYGLSFDQVVHTLKTGSLDLPGGAIKTDHGEILVRAKGQLYTGREFEALPLITDTEGTVVRLGQVATVVDGFEDTDIIARFNGKPAALVQVNRTSQEDVIAISDTVEQYVAANRGRMPAGIELATWFDLSTMVRDRIDLLLRNGFQGIVLVFIALALFLNLRLAFWVSVGIPISFMGAFIVLDFGGETINMISLFAFIMTLGILVDDAIIVGENIFTHYGQGKSPVRAVVDGAGEVGGPVIMAVTTTVVAFTPLMFITGIMGKFIGVMPRAVIAILIVSLGEALIILPAHLERALMKSRMAGKKVGRAVHERILGRIEAGLQFTIERIYTPILRYVVENRYFTFSIGLGVLIVSLGILRGGYVPFIFMPKGDSDWVIAEVNYPLGTPVATTAQTITYLEQQAFKLNQAFAGQLDKEKDLITNTYSLTGYIPRRDWKPSQIGGHCGEVWIEMISSAQRPRVSVNAVINRWREFAGEIPGVDQLSFFTIEGGPAGSPIEIQLIGDDFSQLEQAAAELKSELGKYPGTYDIADDFKPGKPERRMRIKDGAQSIGVTMSDIARQLRQGFYGEEALRIQRGKDDVKVQVRYAEEDRRTLFSIERARVRTPDGRQVPLTEVAEVSPSRAYSLIRRVDRKRVITVSSDIDEDVGNTSKIVADLNAEFLPRLLKRYPGLRYDLEGQEKRTQESLESLKKGFTLALMGIFLLLATQFRSYIQPVIIMMAIPFGLIGAVAGHLVMGIAFTIISIFGIVALSGIVVNDSLILIDFINRAHRGGMAIAEAVVQSGRSRFRPVLLTSVTTIAGLFPLLLERSFQAQFLIPMAVSISFGLLAATLLTLLYVPALYLIVDDCIRAVQKRLGSKNTPEDPNEAPPIERPS